MQRQRSVKTTPKESSDCIHRGTWVPGIGKYIKKSIQGMGLLPGQRVFKRRKKLDKKYLKRCSLSLGIREIQIKATLTFSLVPVRMTKTNKTADNKSWRGCGERGYSFIVGRITNKSSHFANKCGES